MDASTLLKDTVERLKRHEGSYAEICRQNPELTYSWLTKLAQGAITDPKVTSLQQLIDALNAFEAAQALDAIDAKATKAAEAPTP